MAEPVPVEKVPPQNHEAEQSVLGALLIDKEAIVKVADSLRPEDFYRDTHGMIYQAMLDVYEAREPIDLVSLTNRLSEKERLELIGGRTYLSQLANVVPTASHVAQYAGIVQRKATLRRLISAASDIARLGYEESDNVDQTLDQAEQRVFEVSQKYLKQRFVPLKAVLTEAFERIDDIHKEPGKLRGTPTGFSDLDRLLAGLQKSDLIILASRPSVGKTTLALDIARLVAIKQKLPVGIFSLEMSKEQLVDRLICAEGGVDMWKMRTGRLSEDEDFSNIGHAMGVLSEAPIFIDDSAVTSVMEMRTKARRLQSEHGLGLLVVDYLQLLEGRASLENRVQQVAEITRGLKGIAKELNIPVLALSQLSRATEARTPPIPKLADLRESGSIEQDADVVLFIYREAMYKHDTDRPNIAQIFVAKHRNGPTGQLELFFDHDKVSFRNLEKTSQAPAQ
ncbi:MAG: replicative DNA helicase [Candidatus Kerfeldbacteria bacterium]|nr:replicative DNA helicase [Candidatus Kerfeldbacteria bacterium]